MRHSRPLFAALLAAALLLIAAPARACDVPVFRYALERWAPANYDLIVFHKGPLTGDAKTNLEALRKFSADENGYANYSLTTADTDPDAKDKPGEDLLKLFKAQKDPALPYAIIRYPDSRDDTPPLYAGPLTGDLAQALIDSPTRRKIAQQILAGESAVWVFIDSGDKTKDDKAYELLTKTLKVEQTLLKLPEIDPDDPSNANKLRAEVPLKLSFATLRIARNDPKEAMLIANLLKWDEELPRNEPVAFAVLGRGRALPGVAGKDFTEKALAAYCEFIVGRCSCEVKEQNPGFDLLMSADWEAPLQNRLVKDPPFPQLVGLSPIATTAPATIPASVVTVGPITVTQVSGSVSLPIVLGATAAGMLVAVGLGAAVVLLRKPRA